MRDLRGILGESGSTLIESAVSFMVLFLMMFGIFEMALALFAYNYVSETAREATRYAVVRGSSCTGLTNCGATSAQIQTYVQGITYPGINSSNLSVTASWLSANASTPATWTACASKCNAPGNQVKVTVSYPVPFGFAFLPHPSLTVASTSQMVISQ